MNIVWKVLLAMLLTPAGAALHADDRSLEDRLLRPDLTKQPDIGRREFQTKGNNLNREFQGRKNFTTSSFEAGRHETKRFLGIPIPWFGDKKIQSKQFAGADREFVTRMAKAFEKENSVFSDKAFADGDRAAFADARQIPLRKAIIVGKDQKNLDSQNEELSVDEVRELLNKR
jgi:hypothetical protein